MAILVKGKEKSLDLLDREMLIEDPDRYETDLDDTAGRVNQIAQQDQSKLFYSQAFGIKRIVMEDLRNE